MSPESGFVLMEEIAPRLKAANVMRNGWRGIIQKMNVRQNKGLRCLMGFKHQLTVFSFHRVA